MPSTRSPGLSPYLSKEITYQNILFYFFLNYDLDHCVITKATNNVNAFKHDPTPPNV